MTTVRRYHGADVAHLPFAGPVWEEIDVEPMPRWPRKEEAACCVAVHTASGRWPIGFCGPACERRAERDAALVVAPS